MDRLTKRSDTSDMVWFVDHATGLNLEPCEMSPTHARAVLKNLAEYEDMLEQNMLMLSPGHKFEKEDFTQDEFKLLTMAFKIIDDVVELQREGNSDVYLCNELFHLKEKLGIADLTI